MTDNDQINEDDDVIIYRGCARPGDTNFATICCMDEEIVEHLEWPAPLALTDLQLKLLMTAAATIPPRQRDAWLRAIASRLEANPTNDELRQALRIR